MFYKYFIYSVHDNDDCFYYLEENHSPCELLKRYYRVNRESYHGIFSHGYRNSLAISRECYESYSNLPFCLSFEFFPSANELYIHYSSGVYKTGFLKKSACVDLRLHRQQVKKISEQSFNSKLCRYFYNTYMK